MSTNAKKALAIVAGVLVLGGGAFFMLSNREGGNPITRILDRTPTCPLSGAEAKDESLIERPAVGVKIENTSIAYPLSGLEDAEVVYEELVEGGVTRFLALYHCTDSAQAGPIRSSRTVDPLILTPYTKILAAAGGNGQVRKVLDQAELVLIDEPGAGEAMERVPRDGISSEHTLYGNTKALRKLGAKKYEDTPPDDLFEFGDMEGKGKKTKTISIEFGTNSVSYEWNGKGWARSDGGAPLVDDSGEQIVVDNVIIEEHDYEPSPITDITGTNSAEIVDGTGTGRAILFRDGMAYKGEWQRDSEDAPMRFTTADGDAFVLVEGTTWIELVPSKKGEMKGSFSFGK